MFSRRPAIAAVLLLLSVTAGGLAIVLTREKSDRVRSVTVIPFRLLGASDDRYLASSLSETIANRLGAIGGIVVRPAPPGSDDATAVARQLGVDAVITGAVQSSGRTRRITAELYDARSAANVWSRQFDIEATDILSVEDSIAQAIGDRLRPGLTATERAKLTPAHSGDAVAIDEYLRGRDLLDRRVAMDEAGRHLERAVERDPDFAAAWAALAEARMYPGVRNGDVDAAAAAAHRALRIDPSIAEAHAALGFIDFFYRWEWNSAERELRTAIGLNPGNARAHDWYAITLAVRGENAHALAELDRARQIDPQSLDMANDEALLRLLSRDYAGAARAAREVLAVDPSSTQARSYLVGALIRLNRYDEAISENAMQTDDSPLKEVSGDVIRMASGRAVDRNDIVSRIVRFESTDVPPDHLADLYARIGEVDKALKQLERAYESHSFGVVFAARNADFDSLRDDPRFTALLRRIGIDGGPPSMASVRVGRSAS